MKIQQIFVAFVASMAVAVPSMAAVKIKLATLAPKGTVWHDGLMELRDEWQRITDGEVRLVVYPGGVAGEEADVVRKMRIGQLQAGSLTSYGMGKIDVAFRSFSKPLLFRNYAELDHTLAVMGDDIQKYLEDKGFIALQWTDAGWLHFFTTSPVKQPEDLRKLKIATSPDVPEADQLWKAVGYEPVPLANSDILLGFQNNLVGAIATAPLFALAQQWFGVANHMTRIQWVPVFGGTLINKRTWERVPEKYRAQMMTVAKTIGEKVRKQVRADYSRIIDTMTSNGLTVHDPSDADMKMWQSFIDDAIAKAPANLFSFEWLERIEGIVKQHRNTSP